MGSSDGSVTQPKLLIFDLDGTLVDSRRDLVACVNATLQHCGLAPLGEDRVAGFIGDGAAALVERSLQAAAGDPSFRHSAALAFFLNYYREHLLDHTHVYPGVFEALAALRALPDAPLMAVLTNKPVNPSRRICDALELTPYFFRNYGGNSFATKKPDPEGLLALWHEAEGLRGEPIRAADVVMVGDSDVDVRTARASGVVAWGCMWGFAVSKMLAEGPDALAQHPADWPALATRTASLLIPKTAAPQA